jgi:hypothetical protein
MSQQNVEIVRRTNEPFQGIDVAPAIRAALKGDIDAIPPELAAGMAALLDRLDSDVEIDTTGVGMPGFGVLHGQEGMRMLWSRWIEEWERYSWTQSNWSAVREHVVFDVEIRATGKGSGVEVTWNHRQAWTFRDGRMVRWSLFNNRTSALEALGLSE